MINITPPVRQLSVALLLLISCGYGYAQRPQFFIEETTAPAGEEFLVNVRGLDADEAVGVQFSLHWQADELEYLGVDNLAAGATPDGNFNYTGIDTGYIGYINFDMNLQPLPIPDSSVVFSLRFRSLMASGGTTAIEFDSVPVDISAADGMNQKLELSLRGARVAISGTSAITPALADDPRFTVQPNPMGATATVSAELNYAAPTELEVLDGRGRTVLRRTLAARAGRQQIELTSRDLPVAGTYILRLTTDREQLHRRLIFTGAANR